MNHHPIIPAVLALFLVAGAFCLGVLAVTGGAGASWAVQKVALDRQLTARAAILYDARTGEVLYQKNAQEVLPLASLTKLISAMAVLSARSPHASTTITAQDLAPDGDVGLKAGDVLSLHDLLRLGLVASSNDAMAAAAASLGQGYLAALNTTAQHYGLSSTYFLNPTGLDLDKSLSGAYGSAYDLARLAAAFYMQYPEYFALSTEPTVRIQDGNRTLTQKATTLPLQNIAGLFGAKTGYTDLAGGNLAAVFDLDIGHPVVAVVLHSTEDGRFSDIRALVEAARSAAHN